MHSGATDEKDGKEMMAMSGPSWIAIHILERVKKTHHDLYKIQFTEKEVSD